MAWSFILTNSKSFHLNSWCFVPTFVNFGHVVLRKMEMWKVYDNNADKTDKGQIWIRKKNHMLRWAKILVPCANSLFTKLFFLLAKYYLDLKLRNLGHSNKSSPLITFMQKVVELETMTPHIAFPPKEVLFI